MVTVLSPAAIGVGAAACCGVVGLWLVVRFRDLGPQTMRGSIATSVLAIALMQGVGPAMRWGVASLGPAIALLVVAAPILTFAFWSGGIMIRSFAAGPGSGSLQRPERQRVRARFRRRG